ncbi:MAG: ABC transporter permease subunit [bacterium]|nr:ABC transporter permease subunit [bacterium]
MLFWSIVWFEIRYHLKNPLLYITAGLLFLICFGAISSDEVQVGGAIGQVHRNSPMVIIRLLTTISAIGLFIVTAFVASSIQRDFERGTHELFFSRPVSKLTLLGGRFLGSMAVSIAVFAGPVLGIFAGSLMPWIDPERLGPFMLAPYVWAMAVIVIPNVLFMGAVFFIVAGITRSMMATYLGVVGTLVGYGISQQFLSDMESHAWAAMLDPFGSSPLRVATKYWTVVERNTALPEITGYLLANRVLWVGLGLAILALGLWYFDPARSSSRSRRKALPRDMPERASNANALIHSSAPRHRPTLGFGFGDHLRMLARATRLEVVTVLKSAPFVVMLAFAAINILMAISFSERMFGTKVLPVTHLMLETLDSTYLFMLVIIVTFYAGEMIWRERKLKASDVFDALPTPTWVTLTAKLSALGAVITIFTAIGAITTSGYQLSMGYTRLQPEVYTIGLLLAMIPFVFVAVFAVTVQVLAKSKFLGYLVMIAYLLADDLYDALNLDHHLYRFPFLPELPYSDMNGWGHFLEPYLWFAAYWGMLAMVMLCLCALFWVRGTDTSWKLRLHLARQRFTTPARAIVAGGLVGFVAIGAWIFYNTNVINDYLPSDEREILAAEYERSYRQYRDTPLPKVTDIYADVDIYPNERRVEIRGRYELRNTTSAPIHELHLSIPPSVTINHLELPEHTVLVEDEQLGYRVVDLAEALPAQGVIRLSFDITVDNPGFVNNDSDTNIVSNGTFFNSRRFFPTVGYAEWVELTDRNSRRKYGLAPDRRMATLEDTSARYINDLHGDADWITFATTVSTSADQIAMAPGYLQREWREGERRFFHYAMDAPILNYFAFVSAEYEVRRDSWNDVAIEVYYHPSHDTNVDRMIDGVKKSLDYCTSNFGPFQHRQVRILEFPRYESFAQSFPNTIPYSEAMGFISRIDDEEDIDNVFYVTAHEMAHQWWGHQVVGASVQGAGMIAESMSQYTALAVMEREYGPDKMRRFLKYELDRYLSGRGGEIVEEMPLMRVEMQPYIYYRKGSVVMYALRDYIGEDAMNSALSRYVSATRFQDPPYTVTSELIALLKEAAPEGSEALFTDMLSTITLFSNRVKNATSTQQPDGQYVVNLEVEATKLRADGQGVETEVAIDDWVDIGVFGNDEKVLFFEKRRITEASTNFEIVVDEQPARAGIDPYNKLIDRDSDDNVSTVRPR